MRKFLIFLFLPFLGLLWPQLSNANWTNLGIYGGSVYSIAVDPQNPDTLYAGTYLGGGLFASRDGGQSWQALVMDHLMEGEDTFQEHVVYDVAVAPSDSNVIWAVHNFWVARSGDAGATWTHILNGTMQRDCTQCGGVGDAWRQCRAVAVHPSNPDVAFIGTTGPSSSSTSGAVYRTGDGGRSWTKMNQGADLDYQVEDLAVDAGNPNVVWAVTNSNGNGGIWDGTVYRSVDGGLTFTPIDPKPVLGGIVAVALKPHGEDEALVSGGMGVVHLTFDGTQWLSEYPVAGSVYASDVGYAPGDPLSMYAVWYLPWGTEPGPKFSVSRDGGANWQTISMDERVATSPAVLAVDPRNPDRIYVGDYALGVVRTGDAGQTWTPVNQGLDAVIVYDVDVEKENTTHMLAASGSGLYERMSADAAWQRRRNGNYHSVRFRPGDGSSYFAGTQGFVLRTADNGTTWQASNDLNRARINEIAVHAAAPDTVFIAGAQFVHQVLRSTDGGATFAPVLDGVNAEGQDYDFNSVVIDPDDARHVFAGGGNFYIPRVFGDLWESRDSGDTWQRTGLSDAVINAVRIDPRDPNVLYAGCGYSWNENPPLFKSTDGGVTWSQAIDGLPNQRVATFDVWSAGNDHAMAVGWYGDVFHFDGQSVTIQSGGTTENLYGIHGLSTDAVWAVGANGTIVHYDGTQWSSMPSPTTETLNSVWASAPDRVFAVGANGAIVHFDGSRWTSMASGTTLELSSVYGAGGDQVMAVGADGLALRFDGRQWSPSDTHTHNPLHDIWASGPDAFYAVGANDTMLRYDGTDWVSMNPGVASKEGEGIWGTPAGELYVSTGLGAEILYFDGTTWSLLPVPETRNAGDLFGTAGGRLFMTDGYSGLFRFDGSRWSVLRTPGTIYRSVTDLAFHRTNPDIVYASTANAGIFISPNGAGRWLDLGAPPSSVYAITSGSLYAATGAGMYQHTGAGVIAGTVWDNNSAQPIHQATVTTDLGNHCYSVGGDYMMVMPAGIFDLYVSAQDYQIASVSGVTVYGSDVTWHDFAMTPGATLNPVGVPSPGSGSGAADGGGYCFIGSLTSESGPAASGIPLQWLWGVVGGLVFFLCRRRRQGGKTATLLMMAGICLVPAAPVWGQTLFQQVGVASPPVPVGSGARAQGMGGAFIAVADDATAASWNPAGLIQLEKPELSLVGAYIDRRADFTSDIDPEIDNSVDDGRSELNYASAALPVAWGRNMVFALTFQQLYDFDRSFHHALDFSDNAGLDLVQQIDFEQTGSVRALGIAGAIEITPRFSLGVTLNIWTDELGWDNGWREHYRVRSNGTLTGAPVAIDTDIEDRFEKFRGINANLGALWETDGWGRWGIVIKTPFKATLAHRFTFQSTETVGAPVDSVVVSGPIVVEEEVELKMPLSFGIGWSRRFGDAWTLALDVSRTLWDDYTLIDGQGVEFSPIDGRLKSQSQVDPTTHVRLGAEYALLLPRYRLALPLRAGLFYDPEPGEAGARDFYGLALGAGLSRRRFSLDLAYQLRWGTDLDSGNLIANSRTDEYQHTLLASLIYYFGAEAR